jgi:hypothetical protein
MAKRVFDTFGITWTNNALGALAGASSTMSLRSTAVSQLVDVLEVLISGTAGNSQVAAFALVRASANGATETALGAPNSDGGEYPGITALATTVVAAITGGTQPTLSSVTTDAKLNLGLNTFGGIIRWNAAPTQQWQLLGSAPSGGESVLSVLTAGGSSSACNANAHILYEPY